MTQAIQGDAGPIEIGFGDFPDSDTECIFITAPNSFRVAPVPFSKRVISAIEFDFANFESDASGEHAPSLLSLPPSGESGFQVSRNGSVITKQNNEIYRVRDRVCCVVISSQGLATSSVRLRQRTSPRMSPRPNLAVLATISIFNTSNEASSSKVACVVQRGIITPANFIVDTGTNKIIVDSGVAQML